MWIKYLRVHYKLLGRSLKKSPKSNLSLAIAFVIGIMFTASMYNSQTDDDKYVSTFTQWKFYQKELSSNHSSNFSPNQRQVASYQQCSFNEFNLALLQSEVRQLEAKYQTGTPIEGHFYGLDLNSISSIGAQMIADFKPFIGNQKMLENYNFASCKDVPCVLNRIYQDASQISGYATYYWYLKTGSMISTSNFIPEQTSINPGEYANNSYQYQEYLFNQDELKHFYYLAKSLPEKLTFIPLFKTIHKIPGNQSIEQVKNSCSTALPSGHILLSQKCLQGEPKDFFIHVTKEMAKYVDRQEGLKFNLPSISSSKFWLDQSLWSKKSHFNPRTKKLRYSWQSKLDKGNFLDQKSARSPIEQFAALVAYYRFDPVTFMQKTPAKTAQWIKKHIFHDKVYNPQGLYTQFVNQTVHDWSLQEVSIWKKCIDEQLIQSDIQDTQKDLVSSLEHPLYTCVEQKVPGFIRYAMNKIQKDHYEGCQFFNSDHSSPFLAQKKRYQKNIHKFVMEKVLQKKIEIKRHGAEVLIGQNMKNQFIENIDPKAIFIDCFGKSDQKQCYDNKLLAKLNQIIFMNEKISSYYQDSIREDIKSIFPYEQVAKQTHEVTKHFLAPYSARLSLAANKMWDTCKLQGPDEEQNLELPMRFSGGRYFVNPKLVNCLNRSLKEEIYKLAELKAYHQVDNKQIEFKLKFKEQQFALSFLEGKLLQTLNNILDKEVLAEKVYLDQMYKETLITALTDFSTDKETFFNNIFSFNQVKQRCLKKVDEYYPSRYFYHPKSSIDRSFGEPLCEKFVNLPNVRNELTAEVQRQWQINQDVAFNMLAKNYQSEVEICWSDNPAVEGRRPSSRQQNARNRDRREACLEMHYNYAVESTLEDWRSHKHYSWFAHKEDELYSTLKRKENEFVRQAKQSPQLRI